MTNSDNIAMAAPPPLSGRARDARLQIRQFTMPLALLAIMAFFQIESHHTYLDGQNVSVLAVDVSITALLALGMLLVILPGHIDLAAGSGVGLFGAVAAELVISRHWPAPPALLVAAIAAMAIYWGMGFIIVRERVPAFVITLGGLLIFRGAQLIIILDIAKSSIPVVAGGQSNLFSLLTTYHLTPTASWVLCAMVIAAIAVFSYLSYRRAVETEHADGERTFLMAFVAAQLILLFVLECNLYRGIPLPAVILALFAVAIYVLTRHTPFGRYLYAIGGNEEAAIVSGIPVAATAIGAFVIMGFIVAVTGFLETAYAGFSTPTVGLDMELDAIAACVIGGVSLKGGRGTVGGVLLGAMVMAALLNGMSVLNIGLEKRMIARGVVLALAAWADIKLGKK